MYPGEHVTTRAGQPALIMADTGEIVTYAELDRRTNRLAHLMRAQGLQRLDHYAVFMENHVRYVEACGAGISWGHCRSRRRPCPCQSTIFLRNSGSFGKT
jgi:acyl-CoA synthetase (AMP-forming)/AMP-acid ligase II